MARREPPKMKLVKVVGELTPAHKKIYVDSVVRQVERLRREELQAMTRKSTSTVS